MKKNVASQVVGAQLNSKTDGSAVTSGTTTVYVTGDGGTQAAGSVGSGACTHEGNGFWTYAPAQAETNYDHVAFTFVNTSAVNATVQIYPSFPQTGDGFARLGAPAGASHAADVAAVKAVLPAALVSGRIDASVGAMAANVLTATAINADAITAAKIADGAIDAATFAAGAIDAAAIATDAIGALELAAGAATEIAAAVWDLTLAGHTTSGTTGNALNAAGSAGDPWSTALPGAYGSGTAGKIIGDNINATVSSRASQTSVDTVDDFLDTEVAAIKAKTDNLPSDPADASDIAGAFSTVNSTLGAIAGYVDTEVAAVKLVTDHLATALELDGSVYRFTTNALEQAPSGSAPSAAAVADAVWDEALAGHLGAGSTGDALNNANAAGNPWNAIIEGALTASDLLRLLAAVAAGKDAIVDLGGGAATVTFRTVTDSANMLVATMAGSRRTAVVITP